ncbi:MAG TPA: GNAT family N-acetyltransferase [Methylomirabilota bacterium]|nr:GNAT family N-acetyltransferase [Methylomirabilota bacterium]
MTAPPPRLHRATPEDVRGIASVQVRAWRAAYAGIVPAAFLDALSVDEREARWRRNLAELEAETWVAASDGEVVGWATIGGCRDADATPALGELWAIYVSPDSWRGGVGRALWEHGRARLASTGCTEAVVWVLADNVPARRFYAALGFAPAPDLTKTIEIGGAPLREVRLRCPRLGG